MPTNIIADQLKDVPFDLLPVIDEGIDQFRADIEAAEKQKKEYEAQKIKWNILYREIVEIRLPSFFRSYLGDVVWRFDEKPIEIQLSDVFTISIPGLPEFQMKYEFKKWFYRLQYSDHSTTVCPVYKYYSVFTEQDPIWEFI